MPILGETPEVKGLWAAAAVWIKEAPGIARMVAEWMTDGKPEIDPHGSDIARFHAHQKARTHVKARSAEGFNKTYGIVHPAEQWASNRDVRLSPFNAARARARGGLLRDGRLGAAVLVRLERAACSRSTASGSCRAQAEWESRWWSPIINAEHLAMRDRVGMVDLSAFAIFDITGPGALDHVQRMAVAQMDVPVGRVVYTPLLNEAGGIKSDLTIMRLGRDHFRVVTGGAHGMGDRKWFRDHLPADGSAQLYDATSTLVHGRDLGPARPRRRRRRRPRTTSRTRASRSGPRRTIELGGIPVLASRISYVGELGWELYVPMEQGARLWDTLWEAGQPHGIVPFGIGVYGTTGRLEKGYRAHGAELELEFDLVEADMLRPKVKEADFIGRAAYLEQRSQAAGRDAVHADGRRQHVVERRQALHARPRADPDPRRRPDHRRQGPPLVRDERRVRAVGRQAPPAVVPAARVRGGRHEAPRRVLRRALSGDGRRRRLDAAVRPGERAGPGLT